MRLSKTTRYSRHTYGDDGVFGRRNIVSTSFGATDLGKVTAGTGTEYLSAVATGTHTVNKSPRVPRNVVVVAEATQTGNVVVNGVNAEGAGISETIALNAATPVAGTKAFARVTSVTTPATSTVSVGYGNLFGVNARLLSTAQVRVLVIASDNSATHEAAASVATDADVVEGNLVGITTTLDGVKQFRVYALNYNWHADPTNAQPEYGV